MSDPALKSPKGAIGSPHTPLMMKQHEASRRGPMTDTALRKRHDGERNYYRMPCCDVDVGVIDTAVRVTCPACGATLCQLTDTITVLAFAPGWLQRDVDEAVKRADEIDHQ